MGPTFLATARRTTTAVLLAALLAACETTGDPRRGGLVGWSEQQAIERQRALEAERTAAQHEQTQEIQRGAALAGQQAQLSAEVRTLQAHLASALAENDALDVKLRELMTKRQLAGSELARLRQTLDHSRRARGAAQRAAADNAAAPSADKLARHSQEVNRYNQQLHDEVMLLMGR